jgi:hypothetical protein
VLEKLVIHTYKPETKSLSLNCTKVTSKWKTGEKTHQDTGIGKDFLNRISISQEIKARLEILVCIKLKSFSTSKKTLSK